MTKPQIAVRIPPDLHQKLSNYTQRIGVSKTEVIVGALAHYLGCAENLPLNQRVAELESRMAQLEALVKTH